MSTELRDLFNELVSDQPDHGIDLDERIRRGRRQSRVRNLATASLATVVTAGVIGAGFAFRPSPVSDGSTGIAGSGPSAGKTPLVCRYGPQRVSDPHCPGDASGVVNLDGWSTAKSTALAAQLDSLVPEHSQAHGFERYDGQARNTKTGTYLPQLSAGYLVDIKGAADPDGKPFTLYAFTARVGAPGQHVEVFCVVMQPATGPCTGQPRRLADGSTATVHSTKVAGRTRYAVRVVRPDGTQIVVESGITLNDDAATVVDVPVLGPERLLEIAQAITVKP